MDRNRRSDERGGGEDHEKHLESLRARVRSGEAFQTAELFSLFACHREGFETIFSALDQAVADESSPEAQFFLDLPRHYADAVGLIQTCHFNLHRDIPVPSEERTFEDVFSHFQRNPRHLEELERMKYPLLLFVPVFDDEEEGAIRLKFRANTLGRNVTIEDGVYETLSRNTSEALSAFAEVNDDDYDAWKQGITMEVHIEEDTSITHEDMNAIQGWTPIILDLDPRSLEGEYASDMSAHLSLALLHHANRYHGHAIGLPTVIERIMLCLAERFSAHPDPSLQISNDHESDILQETHDLAEGDTLFLAHQYVKHLRVHTISVDEQMSMKHPILRHVIRIGQNDPEPYDEESEEQRATKMADLEHVIGDLEEEYQGATDYLMAELENGDPNDAPEEA